MLPVLGLLCALTALPAWSQVFDVPGCGSLNNGQNGPFDYRTERGRKLAVVEEFHFTPKVEGLIAGQSGYLGQDLDYVLRVFPNHHRALVALVRYGKRSQSPNPPHVAFSIECYFERAMQFKREDTTVRMLYASFLHDAGRTADAVKQLDHVIALAQDNPFTQYNAGMVFADMGLYDRALRQAHLVAAAGFTRPELRKRLEAAGKWSEPAPPEAPAGAASGASAPAPAASSAG
jgi:hypothetical protein